MAANPYGFWTSPMTSDLVVADSIRLEARDSCCIMPNAGVKICLAGVVRISQWRPLGICLKTPRPFGKKSLFQIS